MTDFSLVNILSSFLLVDLSGAPSSLLDLGLSGSTGAAPLLGSFLLALDFSGAAPLSGPYLSGSVTLFPRHSCPWDLLRSDASRAPPSLIDLGNPASKGAVPLLGPSLFDLDVSDLSGASFLPLNLVVSNLSGVAVLLGPLIRF